MTNPDRARRNPLSPPNNRSPPRAPPTRPARLTLCPSRTLNPNAPTLNFAAGQTIPHLVVVKVGAGGQISFANAIGATDVIGDVVGWYDDGSVPGDRYNALPPNRLLDTRAPGGGRLG